jgi:hypothetical protein
LIRWPGHIRPGTRVTRIAGAVDLLPTLAALTGVPITTQKPLDGVDVSPSLLGTAETGQNDRMIFTHWNGRVSVRTQEHRLDAAGRLYDMSRDPGQTRDVAAERPEIAARLAGAVARYRSEVLSEMAGRDDRPFPIGHRDFPSATLPARDGVPHGKVRRSANAPNCSFFTNWTSTDDRMTWDVEVATDGEYDAVVYYTCAGGDVGSTIELSHQGARLEAKVVEAHDPPLRGKEHDRVPRAGESYVKDFKPLRLGTITLKRGRGPLALRALSVPGKHVIDVRAVVLTLGGQ